MRTIELLAPARDLHSAVAAVDCGADAVYMGGSGFGARQAAANTTDDIRRAAEYAHRYGARLYATLNTVVFESELEQAEHLARELIAADVDALIIQDMAYREMSLPVELHASTQMCNMEPGEAAFLERCGFSRVVLERALSIDEIRRIRAATSVELECFIHGAICVGHSGRCFLSRSMSDRSGNRGQCSQPCRLSYDLCDESGREIIRGRHLLSVRDMDLSGRIGEMLDAGIASFKIEGRLKDEVYLRNTVAYYRRAIDDALARRSDCRRSSAGVSTYDFTPDPAKSFTRGASEYMFSGKRADVASFSTPKAVGERLGRVAKVHKDGFTIDRSVDIATGDGLCFLSDDIFAGAGVNGVDGRRITTNRREGIAVGAEVYRNYDRRFAMSVERSRVRRIIDARCRIDISEDSVAMTYTDTEGVTASARRTMRLDAANDPAKAENVMREQAARSGATMFRITGTEICGQMRFVPLSVAGELRREALERLTEARTALMPERRILPDDPTARYPRTRITKYENVVNSLAERFYRRHGVDEIERGLDIEPSTEGCCVMRSSYCLRREIGECLRKGSQLGGRLYLVHGRHRYRLGFDCDRCEMTLTDCSDKRRQ